MTSASPPVLEKGTHSDAAKAICMRPPGARETTPCGMARNNSCVRRMSESTRQLSLIVKSKEGQRGQDRGEIRDKRGQQPQAEVGTELSGGRGRGAAHCRGAGRCLAAHGHRDW